MLHNRSESDLWVMTVENEKYDCFGSDGFENSSIKLKIAPDDFFRSTILDIDGIPGFAFEDSIQPHGNLLGRQTVIMIGFVCYICSEDWSKACSTKTF